MTVGLLYICTGKYNRFFELFYQSSMSYFLPGYEKKYFVWSDNDNLADGLDNVKLYHKDYGGFPADSLYRFEIFLQAETELRNCDYLYYLNANVLLIRSIGEEILPDATGLVGVEWPVKKLSHPMFYHYERNPRSLAYVEPYKGPYKYYMGGLNGGSSNSYLKMIHALAKNIRTDEKNGITACSYDESHINRYFYEFGCKSLPNDFCWPQEWGENQNCKIVLRTKADIDKENKGRDLSAFGKIKRLFYLLNRVARWYLKY